MKNLKQNRTLGVGILIIIVGLGFLFRQMNIFSYGLENIVFSWQMLLILIGVFILGFGENKTFGFILLAVGGFFLLPEIFDFPYNFRNTFWPVLLILVGLFVLFNSGVFRKKSLNDSPENALGERTFIDEVNIFSGAERIITGKNMTGGRITSIFGGSEVDFSKATLSSGTNVLELFYMFGGSSITVPADWVVVNKLTAIFGGFADKRQVGTASDEVPEKTLIVRGFILFGGGEIKSKG